MMTPSPPLPTPVRWSLPHAPVALITALLVAVAGLAVYFWLQRATSPHTVLHYAAPAVTVPDDGITFEGFSWGWPEHLAATAMFQCGPPADKDNRASVVVWTDKAHHVIAFGPAQNGVRLPAYAKALSVAETTDASITIHVAAPGHVMRTSKKKNVLQLGGAKLECIRTWDD